MQAFGVHIMSEIEWYKRHDSRHLWRRLARVDDTRDVGSGLEGRRQRTLRGTAEGEERNEGQRRRATVAQWYTSGLRALPGLVTWSKVLRSEVPYRFLTSFLLTFRPFSRASGVTSFSLSYSGVTLVSASVSHLSVFLSTQRGSAVFWRCIT